MTYNPEINSPAYGDAASTPLRTLCRYHGIATEFADVWGEVQRVSDNSLVGLLAAFDIDASSQSATQRALAKVETNKWSAALPAVCAVQTSEAPWTIKLRVPSSTAELHWHIALEDGLAITGSVRVAQAPTLARTSSSGIELLEIEAEIVAGLPTGYHRFRLEGVAGETLIISAPARCYRPPGAEEGNRVWGPSVQLYSLRSNRNWGIGDFSDLSTFVKDAASQGASLVGVNPLHALFPDRPNHASPYSPSSRRAINVLYIDPEAAEGFDTCAAAKRLVASEEFRSRLALLRAKALVDYEGVASAKLEVLSLMFSDFKHWFAVAARGELGGIRSRFNNFVRQGGKALQTHCIFEALQEHAAAQMAAGAELTPSYSGPSTPEVEAFAHRQADRVLFYQYLQWLAHLQLQQVIDTCRAMGMAVGLYLDLAVSVDRGGSDAWGAGDLFTMKARVGAPVDAFNPNGQDWGLLPMRPDRLRAEGYRYFIETLRENMHGAGALRIDHVMGLMRLFWIPEGHTARSGSYVHYAVDEMLAIVALESQRNHCMVIGEDLGTVAPEMREAMAQRDLLSYRLMYFERDDTGFIPPEKYPAGALVAVSTHDLATFNGWWNGEDLRVRLAQGLYPAPDIFEQQLVDRSKERAELLRALKQAGLITHDAMAAFAFCSSPPAELVNAVHGFLAATPCSLLVVQPEDFLGVVDQANMPGTTTEQPNWRRKLPIDLGAAAWDEALAAMGRSLGAQRPLTASP